MSGIDNFIYRIPTQEENSTPLAVEFPIHESINLRELVISRNMSYHAVVDPDCVIAGDTVAIMGIVFKDPDGNKQTFVPEEPITNFEPISQDKVNILKTKDIILNNHHGVSGKITFFINTETGTMNPAVLAEPNNTGRISAIIIAVLGKYVKEIGMTTTTVDDAVALQDN